MPAKFDADNDSHLDFVHASSTIRARNYRLEEWDRHKVKIVAGKINASVVTVPASMTGVVSNEIFKVVQGFDDITKFKNCFANFALPTVMFSEPDTVKQIKSIEYDPIMCGPLTCIPENFTVYDKITLEEGSLTL